MGIERRISRDNDLKAQKLEKTKARRQKLDAQRRLADRAFDPAFAPHRLPAHPGPAPGLQPGQKRARVAFVFHPAGEAAQGMALAGFGAAALHFRPTHTAADDAELVGLVCQFFQIYVGPAALVQGAEVADAVSETAEEGAELGPDGHGAHFLEFSWAEES